MVELITPAEFARRQGVTPQAVHRAIKRGRQKAGELVEVRRLHSATADKHGDSPAAVEATRWLLENRP